MAFEFSFFQLLSSLQFFCKIAEGCYEDNFFYRKQIVKNATTQWQRNEKIVIQKPEIFNRAKLSVAEKVNQLL